MQQVKRIHVRGTPIADGRVPAICTPLVGRTPDDVLAEASAVLPKRPDAIEWRVDGFAGIGDTALVLDTAHRLRERSGATPIIFTRRSTAEGGSPIPLGEPQVLDLYAAVCGSGAVDIVDYELSNDAANRARVRELTRASGVALILSFHDFGGTPDAATLAAKYAAAHREGADIAKVSVMARDPGDVLVLLGASLEASRALPLPLVSISMGGLGTLSRIAGGVYGSALTFAVGKASSAPGQVPIEDLRAALALVGGEGGRHR